MFLRLLCRTQTDVNSVRPGCPVPGVRAPEGPLVSMPTAHREMLQLALKQSKPKASIMRLWTN